jgi:putative hydrolase of the HAD superfamily
MPEPIRIVCFDLGGVLVRICRSWDEAYQAAGLDLREQPSGARVLARRRELVDLHGTGRITIHEWAAELSTLLGGVYSPEELKRAHHALCREEHSGALELVNDLHAVGIVTACLSNTSHTHWMRFMHCEGDRPLEGPPEYPAVFRLMRPFASHLLGLAKPDPAIYARFETETGAVPHEILFFDDLAENVTAARQRGWNAEQVQPSHLEAVSRMREHLRVRGVL